MIKKSVFEDELIHGMQRELQAHDKKQGMQNLVKAADYLNAAVEILEEAGLNSKADQVLRILGKIALAQDENATKHDTKVKMMPSMKALMEAGVTNEDLKGVGKNDAFSKARVNTAFRRLGYTDKEIANLIGAHNLMSEDEAADLLSPERSFGKIKNWIENPTAPVDPTNPQPGEEISLQSVTPKKELTPSPDDLVFRSIAQELGLIDDQNVDIPQPKSFDEDYEKWKEMTGQKPAKKKLTQEDFGDLAGLIKLDDSDSDDLLNIEIDNNPQGMSVHDPKKTFEDSD